MKTTTTSERKTVGSVVVCRDSLEYLLLKRADGEYLSGLWEIPSGEVERGESLTEALVREVKEETGLTIDEKPDFIGSFEYRSQSGKLTRQYNYLTLVLTKTVQTCPSEHSEHQWRGLDDTDGISQELKSLVEAVRDRLESL